MAGKKIFSVVELTKRIKQNLEDEFVSIWVEGEVSNFVLHTSGHMYFTLKDSEAQIQCVMFRGNNRSLTFKMESGIHIITCGRVSVYEKRGNYQLYVEVIEPKGVGALQLAFEQRKKKLKEEGLFDESNKKKLPVFPQRIGIVTSPTGAAIRDILQIIDRRFRNVHLILNPVKVQGEDASQDIARAIDEFNDYGNMDVLIVGRGGGSLEDLWAFNEEEVARAIYRSHIPIISAVGHEVDFTISDFVADLRAPTPSAAAELVVKEKGSWEDTVNELKETMHTAIATQISDYAEWLTTLKERYAFRQPQALIAEYYQRIDELCRHINKSLRLIIQEKESLFKQNISKLNALSPLAILGRGYSITYKKSDSTSLLDAALLKKGDVLRTKLHHGEIESEVI